VSDPEGEDAMGAKGLPIRDDVPAAGLRRLVVREADDGDRQHARGHASGGGGAPGRNGAARGVTWWCATTPGGLAGLCGRPRPGPQPQLDEGRVAPRCATRCWAVVERTGLSAWTPAERCRKVAARSGVSHDPLGLPRISGSIG
jgi:hypothetical protein